MAPQAAKSSAKVAIDQLTWRQTRLAPVVLVTGSESFLADRVAVLLRDQLRAQRPEVEITDVDASSYSSGTLLALASPSLFGDPRLIRVTQAEKCTDEFIEDITEYLIAPDADTVIFLRHGGGVRGKRFLDAIRSGQGDGIEIVCAELKSDADKNDFVHQEFKDAERRATPGAVRALINAFSSSGAELAAACAQLIQDSAGDIDEPLVDQYYGGRIETNAFKVVDAATEGRLGEAILLLRHALESGADPVPIVAAFANKVRLMARLSGERGSSAELAGRVGAAPWQIDRARRALQNWDELGLARALEVVAETDFNVKGASRDPIFALERMTRTVAYFGHDL